MSYAAQQDLIDRVGEAELINLTDRAVPPSGAVDADVVGAALAGADAAIDGYVRSRYALPIDPAPALLRELAVDLAIYALHRWDPPEVVTARRDQAMALLRDVSTGKVTLPVAGGGEAPAAPAEARVEAPPRRLSRETLDGY